MHNIIVAHLVRKKNGVDVFRCFIESYLKHEAGINHDLLIIYKGFSDEADILTYEMLLQGIAHLCIRVTDFGFDIQAYKYAALKFNCNFIC